MKLTKKKYVRSGARKPEGNMGEGERMGLGSGLFQKLLFVMLFTLFITFIGFGKDFVMNFLVVSGLTVGSWLVVKLLLRVNK